MPLSFSVCRSASQKCSRRHNITVWRMQLFQLMVCVMFYIICFAASLLSLYPVQGVLKSLLHSLPAQPEMAQLSVTLAVVLLVHSMYFDRQRTFVPRFWMHSLILLMIGGLGAPWGVTF